MKRTKMIFAAALAALTMVSCSKENGVDVPTTRPSKAQITINTTGISTRSVDQAAASNDPARFDPTQPVDIFTYSDQALTAQVGLKQSVTLTLDKENQGTGADTYDSYIANIDLPTGAAFVKVVMNDKATGGALVNNRQGGTKGDFSTDAANPSFNVLLEGSGAITISDEAATSQVQIYPEMARIEMVNRFTAGTTYLTENGAGEVTIVAAGGTTSKHTLTRGTILSHFGDLKFEAFYIDDISTERGKAKVDNNAGLDWFAPYTSNPNLADLNSEYNAAGKNPNWGVVSTIANPTQFVTAGLADIFNDGEATNVETAVGYNLFGLAGPKETLTFTGSADAKSRHPHFIVKVSYRPSSAFDNTTYVANAWNTNTITSYINFNAFKEATPTGNYVSFNDGSVYQFTLEDLLNVLLNKDLTITEGGGPDPEDPTIDPDDPDASLTLTVDVMDWKVITVTPELM